MNHSHQPSFVAALRESYAPRPMARLEYLLIGLAVGFGSGAYVCWALHTLWG